MVESREQIWYTCNYLLSFTLQTSSVVLRAYCYTKTIYANMKSAKCFNTRHTTSVYLRQGKARHTRSKNTMATPNIIMRWGIQDIIASLRRRCCCCWRGSVAHRLLLLLLLFACKLLLRGAASAELRSSKLLQMELLALLQRHIQREFGSLNEAIKGIPG